MGNELQRIEAASAARAEGFSTLAEKWCAYIDASPATVNAYAHTIRHFLEYIARNGIERPSRSDVIEYKKALSAELKPATVNSYIVAVRRFFEWAEIEGLYPNIAKGIKSEKISRDFKKDYFTAEQCREMLSGIERDTVKGLRDYALILTLTTCGLRTIEAARANIENLRTVGIKTVLFVQGKGKTDASEFVIVPPQTEKAIREYLKARGEKNKKAALFASVSKQNAGERMTTRAISGIAKEIMRGAGWDDERHTAHSLRHTAITLALIANGGNIYEAAQFARHADISTTTIYAHALEKQDNTCAARIADAIFA